MTRQDQFKAELIELLRKYDVEIQYQKKLLGVEENEQSKN